MKNKYKLGTFVRYARNAVEESGVVNSIQVFAFGYRYTTEGMEPNDAFDEKDILSAYREVKSRVSKPRAKKASKRLAQNTSVQ